MALMSRLARVLQPGAIAVMLAIASVTSGVARAAEPTSAEVSKARENFRRGLALEAAGDWTGALEVFKSVALVKSTPQVRFHIAQCEEKTGDYVGASGSYFKNHLFTHVGYRKDQFKMKTRFTTVRPLKDQWVVDEIPGLFPANQTFVLAKVDGANYGGVVRLNDAFAIGYNYAQSFRISTGEGADTHRIGEKQGVPVGEGTDISARFSLFPDRNGLRRIEFNVVRYHNFRPNDRFNPNPAVNVENELIAIFPTSFYAPGQDYQTTTTEGYEYEMNAKMQEMTAGLPLPPGVKFPF